MLPHYWLQSSINARALISIPGNGSLLLIEPKDHEACFRTWTSPLLFSMASRRGRSLTGSMSASGTCFVHIPRQQQQQQHVQVQLLVGCKHVCARCMPCICTVRNGCMMLLLPASHNGGSSSMAQHNSFNNCCTYRDTCCSGCGSTEHVQQVQSMIVHKQQLNTLRCALWR